MKESVFALRRARRLAGGVWELVLAGDTSAVTAPGQFVKDRKSTRLNSSHIH